MNTPLVSVIMITYNHEKHIAKAILGVLMQEVNFGIELIVANDASPDNTDIVVNEIIAGHPKGYTIKYTRHEHNKGMLPNFQWAHMQAKGKYIALCEGDDYWTDPLKLQKQVNYLRENEDCAMVFHACLQIRGQEKKVIRYSGSEKLNLEEYLIANPFPATASLLFKAEVLLKYQPWMLKLFAGDFVLRYLALLLGNIGYIDEVMCTYNKGVEGSWSKRKLTKQIVLKEYRDNLRMLGFLSTHTKMDIAKGLEYKKRQLVGTSYLKMAHTMKLPRGLFFLLSNYQKVSAYIIGSYLKRTFLN